MDKELWWQDCTRWLTAYLSRLTSGGLASNSGTLSGLLPPTAPTHLHPPAPYNHAKPLPHSPIEFASQRDTLAQRLKLSPSTILFLASNGFSSSFTTMDAHRY